VSPSPRRGVASAWRFALVGVLASLPVTAALNRLPNSGADVAGGIMVVGAFVAGAVAALRSSDPGAAGFRAGLFAGVVAALAPVVRSAGVAAGSTAATPGSPPRAAAFLVLAAVVLVLASAFGWAFGRVGGGVATVVAARLTGDPS
jgi:hypothetical protein